MKKALGVLRIAAVAILVLLLVSNLYTILTTLLWGAPAPIFGYTHSIVLSGSMEPAFSAGDLLIFREEQSYAPGDVVIFQTPDGALVTHRILREEEGGYVTMGDANNTEDGLQPYASIRGRMVAILPSVGHALLFLRTPYGIIFLIAAGVALLEGANLLAYCKQRRKAKGFDN